MKKLFFILIMCTSVSVFAQIDRDQLSLDISKAEAANLEQMKAFLWKRVSVTSVDGVEKLTVEADLKFNEKGELEVKVIDADTDVKQKRGIRGRVQANNAQSSMEYVGEALELAVAYTYMSKGQLLDFFGKAEITEKDGIIQATAGDVFIEGDMLTVFVESETKLFTGKKFSSFLGEDKDPISGEITFEKFKSGVSHASGSVLHLPAKRAIINAKNQDYSIRVE